MLTARIFGTRDDCCDPCRAIFNYPLPLGCGRACVRMGDAVMQAKFRPTCSLRALPAAQGVDLAEEKCRECNWSLVKLCKGCNANKTNQTSRRTPRDARATPPLARAPPTTTTASVRSATTPRCQKEQAGRSRCNSHCRVSFGRSRQDLHCLPQFCTENGDVNASFTGWSMG